MADDTGNDAEETELEDGEQPKKKKLSGKVLVLFILLPLLVVGGGTGGAYFAGVFDSHVEEDPAAQAEAAAAEAAEKNKHVVFYDLPEMLVNLNAGKQANSFLKIGVSLELEDEAQVHELEQLIPRIMDDFQVYLRELRKEDLSGSAGVFRLKEELLKRINSSVTPVKVSDVLFKEMLVQ